MSHSGRLRRRLISLWRADRRCYWCGRETVLRVFPRCAKSSVRPPPSCPEQATIDHLYSRLSGKRQQTYNTETTVLACYECNQRRCREEQAALPVSELHRRSGRFPRNKQGPGDKE